MARMEGKSAIVTGGTRGIGRATVELLLRHGARVAVCSRSEADLERMREEVSPGTADRLFCRVCDVRSDEEVRRFVAEACDRFGPTDVLVNNAGVGRFNPVTETSTEDWLDMVDIDLNGTFYFSREVCRKMKGNDRSPKGYIINVGSICHRFYVPGNCGYAAAKAAQKTFSDYLFEECRADDILVTYLAVGSVDTTFSTRNPGGHWKMTSEEVAGVVWKLIDDADAGNHYCMSYCEMRLRAPRTMPVYKE